ncbi:amidohydrolase family protein [Spirillospora sp. NPDC047279]|uniref:metal-dependent hydrolase family protein n=1 Tax=Spirillospora sp. NPDC047279 TaxID=3155478 RepID=UPI0033C8A71E
MSRLVLTDANLIDGLNPPRPASTVVVEDGRITEVRSGSGSGSASGSGDGQVVDLGGRTVMPGMIICHYHSTYDELGPSPVPIGLEHAPPYQALLAARNLRTALECGFTSVVSAGAANDVDASLNRAIRAGLVEGPRFLPGSREISTTGFGNDMTPYHWDLRALGGMRTCDGADEFRKGIREEIKRGAKVIKLFVTGGHGVVRSKDAEEMSREELAAAIETGHGRGVIVRGHIVGKQAILAAVRLGIDVVDHGDDMDEECVELLAEKGTSVAPSIHFTEVMRDVVPGWGSVASRVHLGEGRPYEMLTHADKAGVNLVIGDDYGAQGLPHGSYAKELETYVTKAGIAPLDVLRWATVNGARLMRRGHDLGSVEPGKIADLLVVDGDPASDITVLQDRSAITVLTGGRVRSGSL